MVEQQAHLADDLALPQFADKPVHQRHLRGRFDNADLPTKNHVDMRTGFALPEDRLSRQIHPLDRLGNQFRQLLLRQRLEERRRGEETGIGSCQRLADGLKIVGRLAQRLRVGALADPLSIGRRERTRQPGPHARAQHR